MAQTGFTPIQLYYSITAGASPIASSLANGELAINITDGKLFYKENTGTISVIGWKLVPTTAGGTGQTTYVNGQLLIGNSTGNTLTKATLTAGSGISVTNGTGSITLANTGVLSFDGGSTGLLPSTATTGVVSLSGTLGVGYGGTGQTTYTNGQLLIGNTTGNTLTKATLTAGSGVTISNGAGSITISATGSGGTVTAVTGTAPVVSSGGTTPAISMAAATASVNGYLTSTDWTTFNNKGSGSVTSVGGTGTVNGITLTGTVTTTGNLTLGGTLSGVSLTTQVSGVLPIANGGTNASTASITSFNNITGYTASGATGTTSTNLVFSTSPTLVTPTLGAALATSIKFGSGSVLSSYETGTWTPVCSRATGGAITAVYDTQLGKYIKVGNVVTVSAFINITAVVTQGSGENRVSGLPYAPADNSLGAGAVARNNAFTTSVIISCFGWGDSEMRFMDNTNSVTPVSVDWKSGVVNFTFSYFV